MDRESMQRLTTAEIHNRMNNMHAHLKGDKRAGEEDLNDVLLDRITAADLCLDGIYAGGSIFLDCHFHNMDFYGGHFIDAVFRNCVITDSIFRKAMIADVQFLHCKFVNCDFSRSEFMGARIKYSTFENCDFSGIIFCNNKLFYSKMNISIAYSPAIDENSEQNVVWEITETKSPLEGQP